MKKLLLLLSIALIMNNLISCKKKKIEEPELTKSELLTAHQWYGVDLEIYVNGAKVNTRNFDLSVLFAVNRDYIYYNNNGDIINIGEWELIEGNPTILRLLNDDISTKPSANPLLYQLNKMGRGNEDFSIEKLTENKLTIYQESIRQVRSLQNDTIKIVYNYKK